MQALGYMQFKDFANRLKMQLFGEDGKGVSIVERNKMLEKEYTELLSKCDRLKKQVSKVW